MTGKELRKYRRDNKLTQKEASRRLGVSQTYLSLLESGNRPITEELRMKAVQMFHLRLTELPARMNSYEVRSATDDQLTSDLAALGYEGFSHWKPSRLKNPADVLLSALKSPSRDARLVEAFPWIVLKFPEMEWKKMVSVANAYGLQNRLGFVTNVARQVAESRGDLKTAKKLQRHEEELRQFKLEREDTLCNETMTDSEKNWLRTQRSDAAKQWNLFTGLLPHHLRYYGQ